MSSAAKRVQSIRGGGVGGAPPPRTGFARGRYPTSSHSATQLSSSVPLFLSFGSERREIPANREVLRGGADVRTRPLPNAQDGVQRTGLHAVLRSGRGRPYASPHASRRSRSPLISPLARRSPGAAAGALRAVTIRRAPSRANAADLRRRDRAARRRAARRRARGGRQGAGDLRPAGARSTSSSRRCSRSPSSRSSTTRAT